MPAASLEEFERGYHELAVRHIDIVLAAGPEIALMSSLATAGAPPIVMIAIDYDPLAIGYVMSLARPGGNITGLFLQQIELAAKQVPLMKAAFPGRQAATVFWRRPTSGRQRETLRQRLDCGLPDGSMPADWCLMGQAARGSGDAPRSLSIGLTNHVRGDRQSKDSKSDRRHVPTSFLLRADEVSE